MKRQNGLAAAIPPWQSVETRSAAWSMHLAYGTRQVPKASEFRSAYLTPGKMPIHLDLRFKPEMFVRAVVQSKVAAGGRVLDASLAGKWIGPMFGF